jgi:endoglucanase
MKSLTLLLVLLSFTLLHAQTPTCPFEKGFNFGAWFQGQDPKQIPNWYTINDFKNLQKLGCDVVRLPINLEGMSGSAPDYTIDPILYKLLDRTVDWAEELGMHILLDNHRTGEVEWADRIQLVALWQQMAEHFKNRSTLVYYEICNEPFGASDADWGEMQRLAIEAIRAIDDVHTIIVSPAAMGNLHHLANMPVYEDDNLIYTFHFYHPMLFTHQGADWVDPDMSDITGVPYPYDAARMPAKPSHIVGTWLEWGYDDYHNQGTQASLHAEIDIALQFREQRGGPIFCGEFGAILHEDTHEDRRRWYKDLGDLLNDNQIAWTCWGYSGGFGIFQKDKFGFPQDLDIPIVEALGLTVPPPGPYPIAPDSSAIILYDDLLSPELNQVGFGTGSTDYWNDIDPQTGTFCISWKDAGQYSNISWQFSGNRDLSYLLAGGYTLSFWMKANRPDLRIEVRFMDTDLNDGVDHPWRMSKTVDKENARLDGSWGLVEIPLSEMIDSGSWHNDAWHSPEGKFDWSRIDKLEFVAEHHSLEGIEVKFDEVQIHKIFRPELSLLQPNGGEKLRAGSTQSITWSSIDINDVKIEYTSDNGATWYEIEASVPAANPKYDWLVPKISSNQCMIKISTVDGTLEDISNSTFSILDPFITVTSPNGGEIWQANSHQNISWTCRDVDKVKIECSVNNGANWITAASLLDAETGGFEWTIPENVSQNCVVKVSDNSDSSISDVSDAVFEIVYPTSVEDRIAVPDQLELFDNYPNPFNPQTMIEFGIPKNGYVRLMVYNNLGQTLGLLVDQHMDAGYHKVVLHSNAFSTDLTSGLYFYRIDFEKFTQTGKMILMR